jgi:biotin carboxylase
MAEPLSILCITSYEKGQEFMREAKRLGCRVFLITIEKRRDSDWPRESLDDVFYMPENLTTDQMINAISYLARTVRIDRIVALDEFDMENAAALREHMRIPGMGATTLRYFRDKLAMREKARESGVPVPPFCPVLNYDRLRDYMAQVPPPWVLKPRSEASAIGIKKLHHAEELWPALDLLGDRQSYYVLEKFLPGDVYHVDAIISERRIVFAEPHKYGKPPMQVSHQGGVFSTRSLDRAARETQELRIVHDHLIEALGLVRGVTHTEFIHAEADGKFYFLEASARVGGAYISDVVEAATGINLWREWSRIEVLGANYQLPTARQEYAGVILTLARQEVPDTSAYTDPEIVKRLVKKHHAGLIVRSADHHRVESLLNSYAERFVTDFMASQPAPADRPLD